MLLGSNYLGEGRAEFLVWAPKAKEVRLRLFSPDKKIIAMEKLEGGYFHSIADNLFPGTRYKYVLNDALERPDPASKFQPEGVHGPSQVVDPKFPWTDSSWHNLPLRDYVIYELHVGTFTRDGTFAAAQTHLKELRELGINAIELMPVAQFPGNRNWGYDGVYPFAVQDSYGGPDGLKKFVNACHEEGMAVILDVVYNHLGPEGNYLDDFGDYYNRCYSTPWGPALNFDAAHSDNVRRFFLENALCWQREFHIDALRLDAVHAIRDFSASPFLEELAKTTRQQADLVNRPFYLIAESDTNSNRVILPRCLGGYGLDAQWNDDFHHCLHVLLTNEHDGYYEDFGGIRQMVKIFREGYAYTGEHSSYRKHRHGSSARQLGARQFVVYSQNHDQIGNRMLGERLTQLVDFESRKLATACVLLSPFIPLLFMGEEYGEPAPFQYMISHGDSALVEAVRKGRAKEFESFKWKAEAPDPFSMELFKECLLNRDLVRKDGPHRIMFELHRQLICFRRTLPGLRDAEKDQMEVCCDEPSSTLWVQYGSGEGACIAVFCFAGQPVSATCHWPDKRWARILDTADAAFGGPGTSLQEQVEGPGPLSLRLQARSAALFHLLRK